MKSEIRNTKYETNSNFKFPNAQNAKFGRLKNLNFGNSDLPEGGISIFDIRIFLIGILLILNTVCAEQSPFHKVVPIRDGFMLDGIDGKVTTQNGQWFFTAYELITDGKGVMTIPAKILPSSMLEKLTKAANEKTSFRIWGKLTTYKGKNCVYMSYFLSVAEVNDANPTEERDTNEVKIIPDEAMALLKPKRVINLAELKRPMGIEADGILADRTGFIKQTKDGSYFAFDAMGRNINLLQLPILQCEELEKMEEMQNASAFPVRFKIAAIVTKYKGKNYLLIQRQIKLYSNGNFAR